MGMFAAFAVLALYTFGRAVYDIGRNDGSHMETGHAGRWNCRPRRKQAIT